MNGKSIALKIVFGFLAMIACLQSCVLGYCQFSQLESKPHNTSRILLTSLKKKYAVELSAIPRLKLLAPTEESHDAGVYAEQGKDVHSRGNLAEAEAAYATSLSLREIGLIRIAYALVLIREEKYLEALPSIAELILVDHYDYGITHFLDSRVYRDENELEHFPSTQMLMAYVLAQIGELKLSAAFYNLAWAIKTSELDFEIARYRGNNLQDEYVDRKILINLPDIPKEIEPEKATLPQLLQAIRLLFCLGTRGGIATKMMKDAYKIAPKSALVVYLYGCYIPVQPNETYKQKLKRVKDILPYVVQASAIEGKESDFGKYLLKDQKAMEKNIKDMEEQIATHRQAYDDEP